MPLVALTGGKVPALGPLGGHYPGLFAHAGDAADDGLCPTPTQPPAPWFAASLSKLATERHKHREEVAQSQAALAAAHSELLELRRQPQSGSIG